jgi:hypothetical protein
MFEMFFSPLQILDKYLYGSMYGGSGSFLGRTLFQYYYTSKYERTPFTESEYLVNVHHCDSCRTEKMLKWLKSAKEKEKEPRPGLPNPENASTPEKKDLMEKINDIVDEDYEDPNVTQ